MTKFGPYTGDVVGPVQFKQGTVTFENGVNWMGTGTFYHVNSALSASGNGKTWDTAFITIAEAVAASLAASGTYDTILVAGTANQEILTITSDYDEAVTIDATQIGLRIIGVGNSPEGVCWEADSDEAILTINAKCCYVSGFRFRPNGATTGCGVKMVTNVGMTTNPAGTIIENCIFRSMTTTALCGVWLESTNDVTIRDCSFTSVISGILSNPGGQSFPYRTKIINNFFDDKLTNGVLGTGGFRSAYIVGNMFSVMTLVISISAGQENVVSGNTLHCASAYETNCVGTSTDVWLGNFCNDVGSGSVGASGITYGYPAA